MGKNVFKKANDHTIQSYVVSTICIICLTM